ARVTRDAAVAPGIAEALLGLPELIGRSEILAKAESLASGADAQRAIVRLTRIDSLLSADERTRVVYDLGVIRGLGYYTGLRFEVFVAGIGRAAGSGGRYDHLLGLYGAGRPAVGFALETDSLADLLAERSL